MTVTKKFSKGTWHEKGHTFTSQGFLIGEELRILVTRDGKPFQSVRVNRITNKSMRPSEIVIKQEKPTFEQFNSRRHKAGKFHKSCNLSCSPGDWRSGGKCHANGCYEEERVTFKDGTIGFI